MNQKQLYYNPREKMRTIDELKEKQGLPLELKIRLTQSRIRAWVHEYGENGVYVSFSGGKDSTVLLDIARKMYPDIKAMFVDVPTQYPELKEFVKTYDNVDIIKPHISFYQVCEQYGFPLISKEVSECVEGARKYLRRLSEGGTEYRYRYDKLCGQGKYGRPDKGGQDNKYRKLRGIGEYSAKGQEKAKCGEVSRTIRNADKGQPSEGEYP